ncbi:hypothetical protein POTOM_007557 [Populus tomentosa]|uniref:Conserved oligomeric Golgi complex subunit 5 helical domain-containing protein n=1 Tax=Populus tomentosa TaxID=118781 RepID=A0A8X8AFR0_POPTO|nr:hypothetical protein POTOM_007557 [Populus tomentosa]
MDLAKAAQLHREILTMCDEFDLREIDVVDEELSWVKETGEKLRSEAMKVLERGMEGLNQAEVGTGLQVFYNLGELKVTVEQLVNKYRGMGVKSVGLALDMKAISTSGGGGFGPGGIRGSGTPQIGGGAKAREGLWQRMGNCMDRLHSIVVAIWHLQRVLSKKRDPFTHVLLLDEIIKEIFTMGYPKLLSLIENLLERISRDTDVKGVLPAITLEGKEQMAAAIEIFQTSFLALCLSRLSDLVNTVFPVSSRWKCSFQRTSLKNSLPYPGRGRTEYQHNAKQLKPNYKSTASRNAITSQRSTVDSDHGPQNLMVLQLPHKSRTLLCGQHLQEIHTRISSMIAGMPFIAADVLSPSLGAIYGVARDSVTPLFKAMIDRLETCILQIHDHNFGAHGMDAAMDNNASPYMEDLQKCILHFRTEFLSRLLPSARATIAGTETICTQLVRSMASRVLIFFIRHASLVRPLSESGKLRMARDMAELELTVGQSLFPVEQLGPPYRALRAFRPLIFLETSQLGGSPLLQDLPPSVVLHHLYTRGPDELESPLAKEQAYTYAVFTVAGFSRGGSDLERNSDVCILNNLVISPLPYGMGILKFGP